MKYLLTTLIIFYSLFCDAQVSSRCPVCPPSLNGVTDGWCLVDSAGKAVWQPCGGSGAGNFWKTTGNANTDSITNFIGTTDGTPFRAKMTGRNGVQYRTIWGEEDATGLGLPGFVSGAVFDGWTAGTRIIDVHSLDADDPIRCTWGYTSMGTGRLSGGEVSTGKISMTIGFTDTNNVDAGKIELLPTQVSIYTENASEEVVSNFIVKQNLFEFDSMGTKIYSFPTSRAQENQVLVANSSRDATWQTFSFTGNAIKDSIAATGATISPSVRTTHVITSAGTITSATLSFPAGTTGDWIIVVFNKAVATLTNSGTGAGTVGLVAPLLGTSKTYVNIGGNWY